MKGEDKARKASTKISPEQLAKVRCRGAKRAAKRRGEKPNDQTSNS